MLHSIARGAEPLAVKQSKQNPSPFYRAGISYTTRAAIGRQAFRKAAFMAYLIYELSGPLGPLLLPIKALYVDPSTSARHP